METAHVLEHAGSFFASVFVVATYTMRTMIPLRVFGILTNVAIISVSVVEQNYPTGLRHCVAPRRGRKRRGSGPAASCDR
jgi:hypothetical protein